MAATEVNKRDFVASLYPGKAWKQRVDHMSHEQVFAIYMKKISMQEKKAKDVKESEDLGF